MKEYRKQLEVREVLDQVVLQAARRGEPMDPEMYNPARKRPYIREGFSLHPPAVQQLVFPPDVSGCGLC